MDDPTRRQLLGGTTAATLLALTAGCLGGDGEATGSYGRSGSTEDLVTAPQLLAGTLPTSRPLISNEDRTVYVDPANGSDSADGTKPEPLETIQEAVQRAPIYLRHQYTIDIATVPNTPVTYDEDILVPTIIGTGQAGQEEDAPLPGPINNLVIRGENNNPGAVEIGSIMFGNLIGTSAGHLLFVTITRDSPYDDEQYGLSAYGTGEVRLYDISFTDGPTKGIIAYGSKMKTSFVDLGQRNLEVGIRAKRHGSIIAREIDGEAAGPAYSAASNSQITIKEGNRATGTSKYATRAGGVIYDLDSDSWEGINTPSNDDTTSVGRDTDNTSSVDTKSSAGGNSVSLLDDDLDIGDIWYEDGSGESTEGFYGLTSNGRVRLD